MSKRLDNIPSGRRSNRPRNTDEGDLPSPVLGGTQEPTEDTLRKIRIAAILLGVFAVLLFIALASYTAKDEANAQLTLRDIIGVIRGDDALRVRFETTNNWLGLLGAVVSHWMFTSTVGVWSTGLPILLMFWARDIYRFQRITPKVTRISIASMASMVVLAALFGTFQLITWLPPIDRIMAGAVGQFLSGVATQLVGSVGSAAIMLVALTLIMIVGFEVNVERLGLSTSKWLMQGQTLYKKYFSSQLLKKHPQTDEPQDEEVVEKVKPTRAEIQADEKDDEPAEFIRPTLTPSKEAPIRLSGAVQIVRPIPHSSGGVAPDPVRVIDSLKNPKPVNINEVEERLKNLHPGKDIRVSPGSGPSDPGDAPELPLFIPPDEDDQFEDVPELPVSRKGLTVTVEGGSDDDQEISLSSNTLYDEDIAYKPPPASLLNQTKEEVSVDDEELRNNARILQEKLETFKVKIENLTVQPGPVITQYEFVPASGIKVAQIENLADDIALALKAQGVRIIAPIPGRGTVGIEIPNNKPAVVRFSSIIKSPKFHNPDIKLPIAMGKTVGGEVYCADLTKMPHLLIAGATGKGKSVGINTIIASLLYRMHPRELKFVIIDPKRVEMALYKSLENHFLAISPDISETIVTEPQNAVVMLKCVVEEMQQRYSVLAAAGQRNIADYNRKAKEGTLKERGGIKHRPMPYIVVVIDELADLMMTAGKDVEEPIVRLAQLARAVGIHCVVATQRPSVDVVTGLIKANFPARIAYQVASRIDSRTILDASGAEHLIGNGDMLFSPGNTPKPLRMQNAFISTDEVEAICEHIGKQRGYSQPYTLPSVAEKRNLYGGAAGGDRDVLFEDAARIFIQLQQASVSTLQRRLRVGYARAARIVDELEMAGIVGPPDGSRGRPVLLQSDAELEAYL
ncbi:MAG: DNA translocase FtsK [Ignavibacteria bacterium]|nr:DNA translocase FtsK [Ignavibacteria bacterium]